MITRIFWHFWTIHVKRMFQENSPVHISVWRLDALVKPDGLFSFLRPSDTPPCQCMVHIACAQSPVQDYSTHFCFVPTMKHNTISWMRAELVHGRMCDMFQSIFKCFPVERDHVQPNWYWAMLTVASRLQLFPFASWFPLTVSTCWIANCVWIAAHGHCMCVCYCRYMTPSQFLLEDTRVFPFGWTEKEREKKKSPCSQKLDYP